MLAQFLALQLTWTRPVEHMRPPQPVAFNAATAQVSNWRSSAIATLHLRSHVAGILRVGLHAPTPETPHVAIARCVRLNNYWCIKGRAWAGEIGHDRDGHAAFASPLAGAVAAAQLLRRYYLDFHRKSAFAIVSHWAPASCFAGIALVVPHADAPHGIGGTLRARWLASHRGATLRRFFAPMQRRVAARGKPAPLCAGGSVRVNAYAAAAGAHIKLASGQDLQLFQPDGKPTAHLAQMMANMAGVEIGPQKVGTTLIAAALTGMPAWQPLARPGSPRP
ncbi:MAG: hypothetical protein KGQ37_07205 [Hyphomicrobiales bacterium]|nr:hypothetical protein [Hyphomicrobiales bacterium]